MALVALLAACSERRDPALLAPLPSLPLSGPSFFHEGLPPAGQAMVCKIGSAATFALSTSDPSRGSFPLGDTVELADGQCAIVWQSTSTASPDTPAVVVNVEELAPPAGFGFDSVVGYQTIESGIRQKRDEPAFRFRVNKDHSGIAEFYNSALIPPPPPDSVVICKEGPPGTYSFTVSQSGGRGGTLPQGGSFTLQAGECKTVWQALPDPPVPDTPAVEVVVDEVNLPLDVVLDSVVGFADSTGPFVQTSGPVRFPVNFYHGGSATFYNRQLPPPPPACDGLTPGYWKNWRNHYTEEQFTLLLQGTIATSIADADAILNISDGKKSSAIDKLRKFVLATQLTLNLTQLNAGGAGLPNPDDAGLAGTCTPPGGGTELSDALATALDMLANPQNYSTSQILAIKDILDAIANLND